MTFYDSGLPPDPLHVPEDDPYDAIVKDLRASGDRLDRALDEDAATVRGCLYLILAGVLVFGVIFGAGVWFGVNVVAAADLPSGLGPSGSAPPPASVGASADVGAGSGLDVRGHSGAPHISGGNHPRSGEARRSAVGCQTYAGQLAGGAPLTLSGIATTYGPGYEGLTAARLPRGTAITICGARCVVRVVNDYGPEAGFKPDRIVDLDVPTFELVCQKPWRAGWCYVTVTPLVPPETSTGGNR